MENTAEQGKEYQIIKSGAKFTVTNIKSKNVTIKDEEGIEGTLNLNNLNEDLESGEVILFVEPVKEEIVEEVIEEVVEEVVEEPVVQTGLNERPYRALSKDEISDQLERYRTTLKHETTQTGREMIETKMDELEKEYKERP